ncbi:uncharacterized protein F5891DRAFT_391046 [Suillus fuscotomentosus]|uniref:Uncharacterized protein n=1 Tax=Suillus fuscotomentosus TaxID=1912939 RepID=A0AAD4E4R1_9AGAM|nr:uncharacterized protein F5891DRAFT_391046 [Suillus fuscotomentosus]KAG1899661.1 hypothetical protein F5891DRAFT_391046 [Suillus fuscotomentosus]
MQLTPHISIMPPVRAPLLRVMLSTRLAENNAAPSSSDLQWQPVIGIVAGFLSILLAVYLIHLLFQIHVSGISPRILGELSCSLLMCVYELIHPYIFWRQDTYSLQALVVSRMPSLTAERQARGPTFRVQLHLPPTQQDQSQLPSTQLQYHLGHCKVGQSAIRRITFLRHAAM